MGLNVFTYFWTNRPCRLDTVLGTCSGKVIIFRESIYRAQCHAPLVSSTMKGKSYDIAIFIRTDNLDVIRTVNENLFWQSIPRLAHNRSSALLI